MSKNFEDEDYNPLLDTDEDPEEQAELTLPSEDDLVLPAMDEPLPKPTAKPLARHFKNQEPEPEQGPQVATDDFFNELGGFEEDPEDEVSEEDYVEVNGTIDSLFGGEDVVDDSNSYESYGDNIEDLFADVEEEDTSTDSFHEAWGGDDVEDEDPLYGFNLDEVLGKAIELGASDVHITPYDVVSFTILGDIQRMEEYGRITGEVTQRLQQKIISNVLDTDFIENLELDTSYVLRTGDHMGRRTRLSVGRSFSDVFMVFRIISNTIPSPQALGIEQEIIDWADLPNGLVLINGPTGTGKTTLIASIIRYLQNTTSKKIITIEKPVEFVYGTMGSALIVQREVGPDARNFANALKSAMRQAPDRMVVGEVRDREEVDALLQAAETGHWAMSTIHASSSPTAINRIKSLYDGPELARVLGSLADNLRGMANQVLLKSPDGKTRFGVREILTINEEVADMIRRGDTDAMRKYQIEHGITMEHALAKVVLEGKATEQEARGQAQFPGLFDRLVREGRGK